MHRIVEAVIHPDGHIETLEAVGGFGYRRALLTILDEPAVPIVLQPGNDAALDATLRAVGLQEEPGEVSAELEPLTEEALDDLWKRIPMGTPLAQIIIEDREEQF
jgi:hypothetical protein